MTVPDFPRLFDLIGCRPPVDISYEDTLPEGAVTPLPGRHACIIAHLGMVSRKGSTAAFDGAAAPSCMGGWTYMGFLPPSERIERFVTTGTPDRPGEHYLQRPESMHRLFDAVGIRQAKTRYCVARPFGRASSPLLHLFYGTVEVISGLATLAWYALDDHDAVEIPFGSGCAAIFSWPQAYSRQGRPRAVLGGMDPSCRPFMTEGELSFTVTHDVLELMCEKAPGSFLDGASWSVVRRRIERQAAKA